MGQIGPEHLGRLFDQHAAALALYARQWCNTPEDVVQEAFVELAKQRKCPDQIAAWLFTVVRNRAISAGRSSTRRIRREGAAKSEPAWFVERSDAALDGQAAVAALEALAAEDREIVVSRLWGGLTFTEIAKLIGATDSTAQRKYVAALQQLRMRLETPCPTNMKPTE